jgi:hypothetical protein
MLSQGTVINPNAETSPVSYGDDSGLYVEFYSRETENPKKSEDAGRPIFESRDYVKIMAVGDKSKQWDRPVRKEPQGNVPADTVRFSRQWEAYKRQEVQVTEGTPVVEWPAITRGDAESLKSINIHTIEQLASLQDNNLEWLGARGMRDKARAWIEKAKDGAISAQWAKEKEEMMAQINALKNQLEGFIKEGVQEASAPPKRGRPKKVKEDEQNSITTDTASE